MDRATATGSSRPTFDRRRSITICGGGNAGHALAVVASQGFDGDIDWLVGSEERADLLRRGVSDGGLHSTGVIEATAHRLRTISADPSDVIPGAGIVLIEVPAFAHGAVLTRISAYLDDRTALGCLPARGGFEFEAAELAPADAAVRRTIFGTQTLPWSTRVRIPGQVVNVGAVKAEVVLAALPTARRTDLAASLSGIVGTRIVAGDSFLSLTLGNPGQFIHPGLMYGHFRSWAGEEYEQDGIPRFFAGATDEMGDIVERLSREAIAVADKLETQSGGALNVQGAAMSVHDWLKSSYSEVTGDTSTVGTCFRTGPIQVRKAPMIEARPGKFVPDFGYRYLSEDVPFGLVATRALAEIADVETPMIDEVIVWAQDAMGKAYLHAGKLEGPDVRDLPVPQNHGVSELSELVAWYGRQTSPVSHSPPYSRPS